MSVKIEIKYYFKVSDDQFLGKCEGKCAKSNMLKILSYQVSNTKKKEENIT